MLLLLSFSCTVVKVLSSYRILYRVDGQEIKDAAATQKVGEGNTHYPVALPGVTESLPPFLGYKNFF